MSDASSEEGRAELTEQLIAAWRTSDAHGRTLLAAIDLESLLLRARPGARTLGEIFAHLVDVRLRRLERIGGAKCIASVEPLEKGDEESRDALDAALASSAEAVAELASARLVAREAVRDFSGGVPAFLGYLMAHDAHHRGQVLAVLAREGKKVPNEVAYGIWKW